MYPFYYPFDNSYYMPQYPPYFGDVNQVFQYYSIKNDIKQQENLPKGQEINTNYSINDYQNKPESQPENFALQEENPYYIHDNSEIEITVKPRTQKSKPITKNNEPKVRNIVPKPPQPKFRYTHKNFESNIINKIFSFLWSEDKSKSYVANILKDKSKTALYFDYIKIIRKYCKRYINKEYLVNLCDYQIEHIAYKIVMKQTEKLKYFSMQQFSATIRKLIFIYLDTICTTSILTSKKMRKDIWREHFEKMRNIKLFLFGKISSEEYDQRMSFTYREIYGEADDTYCIRL